MEITKPGYFDRFRCLAGHCPDSCCKEWEVQVDGDAAAFYRQLPGALGDDLRRCLRDVNEETYMTISDGRCPMWQRDGLCRIQAELGEAALCKTCREFPRLTHDYGDFVELGLELSCPEAARLILNEPVVFITEEVPDPTEEDPNHTRLDTIEIIHQHNLLEFTLYYWNGIPNKTTYEYKNQSSISKKNVIYTGEKVEPVLIFEDVEFPYSYMNLYNTYPVLKIASLAHSNTNCQNNDKSTHSLGFNIDRILLVPKEN